MYTCDIGSCKKCGSWTSSGMFHLCARCARKSNKCASCDGPLDAVKPETPADAKLVYMVGVNVEHYRGNPVVQYSRKGLVRRQRKAFRAWREDVRALLAARGWSKDSVKFVTELPYVGMLVIECTKAVADELSKMEGTESLLENQPTY
jgi:hypothetical protein